MAGPCLLFSVEKCIYELLVVPGGPPFPAQLYLISLKCIIADQRACDAVFGEGKGEEMLHLWYRVPYLLAVSGSCRDEHNWGCLSGWYLFTGVFVCKGTGLVAM